MRNLFKSGIAALFAILLVTSVLGAFAGGAAATPTTSTGDLAADGTDRITNFEANETQNHTVTYNTSVSSDTLDDFDELSLEIDHAGYTYQAYDQTDLTVIDGGADATTPLEVEFQINHSDLEKLPGDAGANTTTNYTITELEAGASSDTNETFEVDYEFDNSHAVRHVHDEESQDDGTYSEEDGWFSFFGADSHATIEDDVGIDGDNTTVMVYSDDSNITGEFDTSLEDADDGERVGMMMSSTLDDEIVYVFANEPGETITGDQVTENDTYIVAHEGGVYEVNLGDDYEGESLVSMELVGNEKFDRADLRNDLDYTFAQSWGLTGDFVPSDLSGSLGTGAGATFAGFAVVAGRRHLGA